MASKTAIIERPLRELADELFTEFFDSILEQSALTPEQQDKLAECLKDGAIEKRDRIANFLWRWEAEAQYVRTREQGLADYRHQIEKVIGCIKETIKVQFENWGVRKVEGRESRFTLKKNPPKVEVFDESALPGEYINYVPTPDKRKIADDLSAGKQIPGARYADPSQRLEIK
jgi:hypothetical protein